MDNFQETKSFLSCWHTELSVCAHILILADISWTTASFFQHKSSSAPGKVVVQNKNMFYIQLTYFFSLCTCFTSHTVFLHEVNIQAK